MPQHSWVTFEIELQLWQPLQSYSSLYSVTELVQLSILQSLEPFRDRSGVASGSCTTERCGLQVEMQNDLHILYV
jgi:hypothetical protein